MEEFYNECQKNVKNIENRIRDDLDKQLEQNKKEFLIAKNYLFNKLVSDNIFKNKIKKASKNGKKRENIYRYSITDRIYIPELLRSYNIDTLINGTRGPDTGTIIRFAIQPIFKKFQDYIFPFKVSIIKEGNTRFLEINW